MALQNKNKPRLLKAEDMTWHYCICGAKVWAPRQVEPGDELTCDKCAAQYRAAFCSDGGYWEPVAALKIGGRHGKPY